MQGKKMKIGVKLIIGYGFVALLAGIVGGFSIYYGRQIQFNFDLIALSHLNESDGSTEIAFHRIGL